VVAEESVTFRGIGLVERRVGIEKFRMPEILRVDRL
jgi:hypothetical protein